MQVAKKTVDPFAHIRTEMLEVAPICRNCGNFRPEVNISALSRETGISPVQLSGYLKGTANLGRVGLTRALEFLAKRKDAPTDEQAAAVAEAQSL